MPARINGIGTTYFGKKNLRVQQGVCESCHRPGPLSSYETRLWFSVFFVPVIPLTRKQVIDYCPRCRRHQVMPLERWHEVRAEAIGSAIADVDANPDSPEHAVRCHATMAACGKREDATKYAEAMSSRFGNNADVLMYLGGWFERIGQSVRADECFDRALTADPQHPGALRAAAVSLAQQNKPREAELKLATLQPNTKHFDPTLFFAVGQAYQNVGEHEAALRLFKVVTDTTPSAAKEKKFRQAVRKSEAALGQYGSVLAPITWYKKPAVLWSAVASIALVTLVAADRYFAASRELFVVNGLTQPLKLHLDDGGVVQVPAQGRLKLLASEGSHRISLVEPAVLAHDEQFSIDGGVLGRWRGNQVCIADPTHSAIVVWEESVYAARAGDRRGDYRLHAAEPFLQLDDIDYKFQEFPNHIQVDSSSKTVTKHRVGLMKLTPLELLVNAPDTLAGAAKLDYIEAHLATAENRDVLLRYYWQAALEEKRIARCRDYLKRSLGARPVDVDWHRVYQSAAELSGEGALLASEYDALLAKEPGNTDLLYLRRRIEPFGADSTRFFDAALQRDPNHSFTWSAKAYLLGGAGQFDEALAAIEKAVQADQERGELSDARVKLLQALGRHDQVVEELRQKVKSGEGPSWSNYSDLIDALALQGKFAEAARMQAEFAQVIDNEWPQDPLQLKLTSRAVTLLMAKKYDELQASITALQDSMARSAWSFTAHLCQGDPEKAASDIESGPLTLRGINGLCLCIGWRNLQKATLAQEWLKRAISQLSAGTNEQRIVAQWLQQPPADLTELMPKLTDIALTPDDKVVVLLALAEPGRPGRDELIAFAEKLSVWPSARRAFVEASLAAARLGEENAERTARHATASPAS